MIEIKAITELDQLKLLKSEYLDQTTAPLDGMWLCGFVPLASHFGFYKNSTSIGYCCINDEGNLLQFYLRSNDSSEESLLLMNMLSGKYDHLPKIEGAFVSTAEPDFLSYCFDNFSSFKVNAIMYQLNKGAKLSINKDINWTLRPVDPENLSEAVEFGVSSIGAPKDWLAQYWSNLIQRQELFGCWLDDELIGTGENRKFDDFQEGYTDIGVIVSQQQRGKGLATWILQQLVQMAIEKSLEPICSTERDNIGAQKAIIRAGFVARNRIVEFMV
jgi:RimJ/RimL family protein N-acetyltransferase